MPHVAAVRHQPLASYGPYRRCDPPEEGVHRAFGGVSAAIGGVIGRRGSRPGDRGQQAPLGRVRDENVPAEVDGLGQFRFGADRRAGDTEKELSLIHI